MGRYDPIYSGEQREAIVRAVLEEGLSAREAVEKAGRGDLDIPAFQMPVSTAQTIVTQSKRRRLVDGWNDRIENGTERLLVLAETELAAAETRNENGEPDHGRTKRAADNLFRVQRLVKGMEQAAQEPPQSQTQEPVAPQMSSGLVEEMVADMERQDSRHRQDPTEPSPDERKLQGGRALVRELGP